MIRLRQQGQREAKRIWNGVNPDDLDATFNLGQLELTVSTLQREAARLSSAYLSTFIASELGEPERPPALSVWDKAFGGGDLREALRSPVIKAKMLIKDGSRPRVAVSLVRPILVSDVGLFIDTAARESLRQGMEMDDRIVGYQRALKGTCGACAGSRTYEAFSENAPVVPLMVHPNCQCVAEPVVTKSWHYRDQDSRLGAQTPQSLEATGVQPGTQAAAAARAYTTGSYRALNEALARGKPLTADQEGIAKALRGSMRELPEEVTTWRGVRNLGPQKRGLETEGEFEVRLGKWAEDYFKPNSIVETRGFQSTSFDINPALDAALGKRSPGIIFEIRAKNGAYLGRVSEFSDEAELLLSDRARFKVRRVLKKVAFEDLEGNIRHRVVVQLVQL
jgi:hypothetical protein